MLGEFKDDQYDGYGMFLFQDEINCEVYWKKYEGDWKGGKKHGKGKEWHGDGDFYEGLRIEMKISILNIVR